MSKRTSWMHKIFDIQKFPPKNFRPNLTESNFDGCPLEPRVLTDVILTDVIWVDFFPEHFVVWNLFIINVIFFVFIRK